MGYTRQMSSHWKSHLGEREVRDALCSQDCKGRYFRGLCSRLLSAIQLPLSRRFLLQSPLMMMNDRPIWQKWRSDKCSFLGKEGRWARRGEHQITAHFQSVGLLITESANLNVCVCVRVGVCDPHSWCVPLTFNSTQPSMPFHSTFFQKPIMEH